MSDEISIIQPECDKIEIWDDDDFIFISQDIPLLRETHLVTISKAFVPRLQEAIKAMIGAS